MRHAINMAVPSDAGTFTAGASGSEARMAAKHARQPDRLDPLIEALGKAVARRGLRTGVNDSPPTYPGP